MPLRIRRFFAKILVAIAFAFLLSPTQAANKDEERLLRRSGKIATSIRNIQADESSKIPASVMSQAKGIIILKQYEAGVIFGAKGGFGLAMKRAESGDWGPPAWIKTGEISGGLQLGAQKLNVVLIIVNDKSLRMLEKAKFQIGVDASVTRGPTGSNYEARIGENADILAYTDYQGYYAGATFEGSFLLPDRRSNDLTYGERLEVAEIINSSELPTPAFLADVLELLAQIETSHSAE
ncbi:hypothetical protein VDG1235_149 [Verrucomicrobiia bacterium DG1235]|nr:hypothetical protein VDG1235_149 [Verrucomicrobiae bacterium DG1235]